jgi:hypothetical protein
MTIQDYLNLIPSANSQQPKFTAMITADVSIPVQVQNLLSSMIPIFELSLPPVGNQLDIIGQWVGVSRNIPTPITGVYFAFDGATKVGWDYGVWAPIPFPAQVTSLPDDAYLTIIIAKIAANNWDGTTAGAYAIWEKLFSNFTILIQDHCNMSYAMCIVGETIDSLTLALIQGGYIPLRPEGIQITEYFISPGPVFAWDSDSSLLKGWDTGLWATEIAPT